MTFGAWILEHLTELQISVYKLEKDCNFGRGAVYRWENKNHYPKMDSYFKVIKQIAKYRNEPVQVLVIDSLLKIEVKR